METITNHNARLVGNGMLPPTCQVHHQEEEMKAVEPAELVLELAMEAGDFTLRQKRKVRLAYKQDKAKGYLVFYRIANTIEKMC